jgi:hypothetical protein
VYRKLSGSNSPPAACTAARKAASAALCASRFDALGFLIEEVVDEISREILISKLVIADALQRILTGNASVGQLDQVLDLAVEKIYPDHTLLAEPTLIAEIDAAGRFGLQLRIADEVIVAKFAVEQRRNQLVEIRAASRCPPATG